MPNPGDPFNAIVQFQVQECINHGTTIAAEDFQIGEPYDGYIERAPILFLSSNPAFDFNEVSPRYDSATGNIFEPAHTDPVTGAPVPQRNISFDGIKKFLQTRIITSPANDANDASLRIPLKNGTTQAVPYWGSIKNKTQMLLPAALTGLWGGLTPSQQARETMKYAVCMEVVPFRSTMAAGVTPNALNKCWDEFTIHLLERSAADIIVLAGMTALDTFCSKLFPGDHAQKTTLGYHNPNHTHNVLTYVFGDRPRTIVWAERVPGGAALRNWDDGYFAPGVLANLQAAVANSNSVHDAIANGGILP